MIDLPPLDYPLSNQTVFFHIPKPHYNPFMKPSLIVILGAYALVEEVSILSQGYGNLFTMSGSEWYYPFPLYYTYILSTKRCEYLNTAWEVLVYFLRAYYE